MSKETEIERLTQAQDYFQRYYQLADAVETSKENKEYLKTYIHDNDYVQKNFNLNSKIFKGIIFCVIISLAFFLFLFWLLGKDLAVISIIAGAVVLICSVAFVICLNKYRLTAAEKHQRDVNDGIKEQIELIDQRIKQREQLRDNFYTELQKRVDFISIDYLKYIDSLKKFINDGRAETCEDAVALLDQKLLLKQMNDIIEKSEEPMVKQSDKERFGDPLELIKKKKKKFFSRK